MNKDLQTEVDMVFERAIIKSYNKMSYCDGVKHVVKSYLFTKSKVYKEIISRREAAIFREWQVSKLAMRGKEVKKESKLISYLSNLKLRFDCFVYNSSHKLSDFRRSVRYYSYVVMNPDMIWFVIEFRKRCLEFNTNLFPNHKIPQSDKQWLAVFRNNKKVFNELLPDVIGLGYTEEEFLKQIKEFRFGKYIWSLM